MAYVIAEPCVDQRDQSCAQVCPVDCISADPEMDRKFYVDAEMCIDCGSCVSACPNDAIFRTDQLPDRWVEFAQIDATWFTDPTLAREQVDSLVPR